ncbi:ATP-binding cassette domain-containing protein [bacterium]|jgi:ABC-type transport system involved in cytochrome c biogenesis ATPase subunit|nr:ATP-binding cassette domain-containing protein [bacterium]NBW56640.1 ATP-binding cassette domain-containing protein [bacterium]NBX72462.1 ATP-binding cassette domain-containing protein [bacterium]
MAFIENMVVVHNLFSVTLRATLLSFEETNRYTYCPEMVLKNHQIWHIKGSNGIGKTSLLRFILNFIKKHDLSSIYLPHELGLFDHETLEAHAHFYQNLTPHYNPRQHPLWLAQHVHKKIFQLSRGLQQRAALSLRLSSDYLFWILDEPFTALDQEATMLLIECFLNHQELGGCIIFTHHGILPSQIQVSSLFLEQRG